MVTVVTDISIVVSCTDLAVQQAVVAAGGKVTSLSGGVVFIGLPQGSCVVACNDDESLIKLPDGDVLRHIAGKRLLELASSTLGKNSMNTAVELSIIYKRVANDTLTVNVIGTDNQELDITILHESYGNVTSFLVEPRGIGISETMLMRDGEIMTFLVRNCQNNAVIASGIFQLDHDFKECATNNLHTQIIEK